MTRTDVVASSRPQKAGAAPKRKGSSSAMRRLVGVAGRFRPDDGARCCRRRRSPPKKRCRLQDNNTTSTTTQHDTDADDGDLPVERNSTPTKTTAPETTKATDPYDGTDGEKSVDASLHGLRPSLDDRRRRAPDRDGLLDRHRAASPASQTPAAERTAPSNSQTSGRRRSRRPFSFAAPTAVRRPEAARRRDVRLMRMRGLEPPPGLPDTDLNRARLPIPPHPREGEGRRYRTLARRPGASA